MARKDESKPFNLIGILIVWFIISFVHFWAYQIVTFRKLMAHQVGEIYNVDAVLHGTKPDSDIISQAKAEVRVQGFFEKLLSLPVLVFILPPENKRTAYAGMELPFTARFINSLAAGALIHIALLLALWSFWFTETWKLRGFLEGREIFSDAAIPSFMKNLPFLREAGLIQKFESTRYGGILIIAFVHFALSCAANWMLVGERLVDGKSLPFFTKLMFFPLTPIFFGSSFWFDYQHNRDVETYIVMCNSLLVAVFIRLALRLARGR